MHSEIVEFLAKTQKKYIIINTNPTLTLNIKTDYDSINPWLLCPRYLWQGMQMLQHKERSKEVGVHISCYTGAPLLLHKGSL